jgi:hypothetical protein
MIPLCVLIAVPLLHAQAPPPTQPNQVLAILTVKADAARDQLMKVLPAEVRDTVQLYLDGKIQQWYSRGDGKGVVFIMNCKDAAEAKVLTDQLPLSKAKLVDFDYMPLAPLSPLRVLLGPPTP